MRKRNALNSPRLLQLKRKRQKAFNFKLLLWVIAIAALFAVFIYVSRMPKLNIVNIEITGNKVTSAGEMERAVKDDISGYYLWSVPKTNFLFYPKGNIKADLAEKFKGLKDIEVNLKENQVLEIAITERTATYTWCGQTLPLEAVKEKCYFMDPDGLIFDEAPYFSGDVYFKFYGGELASGQYFYKDIFPNIILFKKGIEDIGLKPVSIYGGNDGEMKMFLSKKGSSYPAPEVLWKSDADVEKISDNLETALSTEPLKSDIKNKYSLLEYLDLRFGSKVYYRFR